MRLFKNPKRTLMVLGLSLIFALSGCATLQSFFKSEPTYRELTGIWFQGEKVPSFLVPDKFPDFSVITEDNEANPYYYSPVPIGNGLVMLSMWLENETETYALIVGATCPVLIAFKAKVGEGAEYYRYEKGKPIQCTEKEYKAILETKFICPPTEKTVFNELGKDLAELQKLVIELNKSLTGI